MQYRDGGGGQVMQRNIDTGGALVALVESTANQEREQGRGRVDERGGRKRGRDNEYEYCIEANVVVYSSRGVNTRAKTFSRDAFSTAVTHGEPSHTHTHTHMHAAKLR